MSMLQISAHHPQAPPSLVIQAASHAIESRVLGTELQRSSSKGVGFSVVDSAMPVHVLSIHKHGRIIYFLPEHKSSQVSVHFPLHIVQSVPEELKSTVYFSPLV